jgi:colicin import membrane protein
MGAMSTIGALWKKDPGLVLSAGAHLCAFVLLIANFSRAPDIAPVQESVPVDVISSSDLNEITNGEKTAKPLPTPQRRVDQVAEVEDHKPAPPLAEAKKDTPPPPAPEKPNDDPGEADKPNEASSDTPPPSPPERPDQQVPTPPERPAPTADATPTPPDRPEPDDAEALEKKTPPKPPKRPELVKKADTKKAEPKKPDVKKTEPKKSDLDEVAKLLDKLKKPVAKARSGNEAKEARRSNFSFDKISALLDHEAPQRRASTGQHLTQLASLGSPTAHAAKLSPSLMAQIDGWLIDHYRGCWSYFGLGATQDYVPRVRVRMAPDGSLIGKAVLLNPPGDPNLQSLADSAMRAVDRCNPMEIPDWLKPHYDAWRDRTVRFDPKEMS